MALVLAQYKDLFQLVRGYLYVVESSLLGMCYFNGKNREKNSRKANDEFGCNLPNYERVMWNFLEQ